MSMRIFSLGAVLLSIAACGGDKPVDVTLELDDPLVKAEAEASKMRAEAGDGKLSCAVSGATVFARVCELERSRTDKGLQLTVRHPDGGFRRLIVVSDGRGVVAADGSEKAVVTPIAPREIEVAIAGNRYRLPATIKGQAPLPKAAAN